MTIRELIDKLEEALRLPGFEEDTEVCILAVDEMQQGSYSKVDGIGFDAGCFLIGGGDNEGTYEWSNFFKDTFLEE